MLDICVAHLVWKPFGVAPFSRFLDSYRRRGGGVEHQLLIIFNGFSEDDDLSEYHNLLDGINYRSFSTPRPTQDIPAYFAAAHTVNCEYFCFLNSHSQLLDENWLTKMHRHTRRPGVGLVGATGSYESAYTNQLRGWHEDRSALFYVKGIVRYPKPLLTALKYRAYFPPFPNHHVRTNAFMLSSRLLSRIHVGAMRNKLDAERFESGRRGLTRQVEAMGLEALVVGRDSEAYQWERWHESNTFRGGEQRNLLVADNRTLQYGEAEPQLRQLLSEYAWGKNRLA
jgi:hypothetical protein